MPYIASNFDGAHINYRIHETQIKNNPKKPTLVFAHGWPMGSRIFDHFIVPLVMNHGYRCISHDRRGFGKSEWAGLNTEEGKDVTYDVFADDLAQVLEASCNGSQMKSAGFIGVGASMGCGELVHLLQRHKSIATHCKGLVFLGSNLPNPIYSEENPLAPKPELWESILEGIRADRQSFMSVALGGAFGAHVGVELTAGEKARVENIIEDADAVAIEKCARIILRDFTNELVELGNKGLELLVIHGDADNSLPYEAGASKIPQLVKNTQLELYEKAAHGLWLTHKDQCMRDMLKWLERI